MLRVEFRSSHSNSNAPKQPEELGVSNTSSPISLGWLFSIENPFSELGLSALQDKRPVQINMQLRAAFIPPWSLRSRLDTEGVSLRFVFVCFGTTVSSWCEYQTHNKNSLLLQCSQPSQLLTKQSSQCFREGCFLEKRWVSVTILWTPPRG